MSCSGVQLLDNRQVSSVVSIQLKKNDILLRRPQRVDAETLAQLADDKSIWNNVRDYFPHPYTIENASAFISQTNAEDPPVTLAILFKHEFAGVIGIKKQPDIYSKSGEVGYWVGVPYQGRGIATTALQLITEYGVKTLDLNRLFAGVFSHNLASMRVLEKCGYLKEGISVGAVWKNDRFLDEHRYAYVKH